MRGYWYNILHLLKHVQILYAYALSKPINKQKLYIQIKTLTRYVTLSVAISYYFELS